MMEEPTYVDVPPLFGQRMIALEALGDRDSDIGTVRLRHISRDQGLQIAELLKTLDVSGSILEIGTGGGYSTLWMLLGTERPIITLEKDGFKANIARDTFGFCKVNDRVALVVQDAYEYLANFMDGIAFCFVDAPKQQYANMFSLIDMNLVPGGLLVFDNVLDEEYSNTKKKELPLTAFAMGLLQNKSYESAVVLLDKPMLVCRKKINISRIKLIPS